MLQNFSALKKNNYDYITLSYYRSMYSMRADVCLVYYCFPVMAQLPVLGFLLNNWINEYEN